MLSASHSNVLFMAKLMTTSYPEKKPRVLAGMQHQVVHPATHPLASQLRSTSYPEKTTPCPGRHTCSPGMPNCSSTVVPTTMVGTTGLKEPLDLELFFRANVCYLCRISRRACASTNFNDTRDGDQSTEAFYFSSPPEQLARVTPLLFPFVI